MVTRTETFEHVTALMNDTYKRKNADYGDSFHVLFAKYGMTYALAHLEEKLNRICAITKNGENKVKNEGVIDSLLDMANYAILTYMEIDE